MAGTVEIWGIQTWDANGNANNYGINPVNVVGTFRLNKNQITGDYKFTVPLGCKLDVMPVSLNFAFDTTARRRFVISGGTVSVKDGAGYYGVDADQASEVFCLVIAVRV